jgi:hypothetical protein
MALMAGEEMSRMLWNGFTFLLGPGPLILDNSRGGITQCFGILFGGCHPWEWDQMC